MSVSGGEERNALQVLVDRLPDQRGRRVVFLSHCLLNENTRYLGGACRTCCVREVIEHSMDQGVGMVQMPCPEQQVWGGVLKTRMLALYGRRARAFPGVVKALLPVGLLYVRWAYRAMARKLAAQIDDYANSGFAVVGIVGIDGSPTCGVRTTLDITGFVGDMLHADHDTLTTGDQNAWVRKHAQEGQGLFVQELERALQARHLRVPLLAHDLLGELEGRSSDVRIDSQSEIAGPRKRSSV
jgi:predicted secreted protein